MTTTKPKAIAAFAAGIGIGLSALTWMGGGDLNVGPTRAFTAPTAKVMPANDPAQTQQTSARFVQQRYWEDGSYRIKIRLPKTEWDPATTVVITGCRKSGLCQD